MIWIYRLIFPLLALLLSPKYVSRMLRRGGYGRDWRHRFGRFGALPPKKGGRVWLQAVSVGEALAVSPVIDALCAHDIEVVLTTTTSTGYALAQKRYGDRAAAVLQFPMDWWPFSRAAWKAIQPDLVILMESELWPEHLRQARNHGVPVLLANARLSDKSYSSYLGNAWLANWLFPQLTCVLASSEQARERFGNLGVAPEALQYTGNLKCDVGVAPLLESSERAALRAELGFARDSVVLMGSSTWPGEEAFLLDVANKAGSGVAVLIVPRHAERREEIRSLMQAHEVDCHFRSEGKKAPRPGVVYVADTTGELARLSQAADVAFIGKSLPPNDGGQTPIEAAALGLPIVYGPAMSNFRDVCASLEQAGGAVRAADAEEAGDALLSLLRDPSKRAALGAAATHWHNAQRGATEKTFRVIMGLLQEQAD